MAAGATYTPIASYTITSNTPSITFSSISGSYTDLRCVFTGRSDGINDTGIYMQLNGNTGNVYSNTVMYGAGSSATSAQGTNQSTWINVSDMPPSSSSTVNTLILDFLNYSNTTTYKTVLSRDNRGSRDVVLAGVVLFRSTSAITSIMLSAYTPYSRNIAVGTATLYGITAA